MDLKAREFSLKCHWSQSILNRLVFIINNNCTYFIHLVKTWNTMLHDFCDSDSLCDGFPKRAQNNFIFFLLVENLKHLINKLSCIDRAVYANNAIRYWFPLTTNFFIFFHVLFLLLGSFFFFLHAQIQLNLLYTPNDPNEVRGFGVLGFWGFGS